MTTTFNPDAAANDKKTETFNPMAQFESMKFDTAIPEELVREVAASVLVGRQPHAATGPAPVTAGRS